MDGKEGAGVTAGVTSAGGKDKPERRSAGGSGGGGGGGGMDLSEENVDAFYKKMLVRAPNKRQVCCVYKKFRRIRRI